MAENSRGTGPLAGVRVIDLKPGKLANPGTQ